ncbi:dinucleotide-utilizing enzyme [Microbacterium ulmi]|uniref:dinucleotide-utilizing enzyme n=1 Tax=Microbacterium ulmi TaxID=179095 RepID=UPI001ABA5E26|nr:dinucleotide-utilizing enzyme [Microbacterium ulmi]NII70824.1 hypothetical protein [Microbacterium ulmi]
MSTQPRLTRSIPFWVLIAGSLASAAVGAWLVVEKTSTMTTTLTDGSATGVEVYAGQAWVTLGAVLVGAGLVGFVAALFLGAAKSLVATAPVAVVEPLDWADEDDAADEPVEDEVASADEPVGDEVAAAEEPVVEVEDAPAAR